MTSTVKMFVPKITKICQPFFKSQSIMFGILFDVFLFILIHFVGSFFLR